MELSKKLRETKKTLYSFEILPPLKGQNIDAIYKVIDELIDFNPMNINITYHQQEVVYKDLGNNLIEKRIVRKRPGTVAIAAAIDHKYKDTIVVPHIICGGFSKEETEDALIDLNFLGINNLLVVRGDPPANYKYFKPDKNGHSYSYQLVEQIMRMNKGIYCDEELKNTKKSNFSVGVAGYPEKHNEIPNIQQDILFLKQKIDAGADYVVTQMFFDNKKFFDFVKMCRDIGITVPIVPGIKPITRKRDLTIVPQIFNVDIPVELSSEIYKAKTDEAVWQIGQEWTIAQSKELMKFGVPEIHYFTVSKANNIKNILKNVF